MKENREVARQLWESPQGANKSDSKCKEKVEKGWMAVSKGILTNSSRGPPPKADYQRSPVSPSYLSASVSISAMLHH